MINLQEKAKNTFTQFWDMHSGGEQKEKFHFLYIEATEDEAKIIFYNRFNHNPDRVTCTCCGNDYSISEGTLQELTSYHRDVILEDDGTETPVDSEYSICSAVSLEDYLEQDDVAIIYAEDIKNDERTGYVPEQGYVWRG